MCIIVDNNARELVFGQKVSDEFAPVRQLLFETRPPKRPGVLVLGGDLLHEFCGGTDRSGVEHHGSDSARKAVDELRKAGRLIVPERRLLDASMQAIQAETWQSNDQHVLALAHATGAEVVVMRPASDGGKAGDAALIRDFKSQRFREIGGPKVRAYTRKSHARLLRETCDSCRAR